MTSSTKIIQTYSCTKKSSTSITPSAFITLPSKVEIQEGRSSAVMISAIEDDGGSEHHEFWYAQVLGIFSAQCRLRSADANTLTRLDFLWVRWYGRDPDEEGPGAFGFINPTDVIRAMHLIPAFTWGRNFYVNRYVLINRSSYQRPDNYATV